MIEFMRPALTQKTLIREISAMVGKVLIFPATSAGGEPSHYAGDMGLES
jgi:hypothetical protein